MSPDDMKNVFQRFELDVATITKNQIQTLDHCEKQTLAKWLGQTYHGVKGEELVEKIWASVHRKRSRELEDDDTTQNAKKQKKTVGP